MNFIGVTLGCQAEKCRVGALFCNRVAPWLRQGQGNLNLRMERSIDTRTALFTAGPPGSDPG
jgi:hypothetical protein